MADQVTERVKAARKSRCQTSTEMDVVGANQGGRRASSCGGTLVRQSPRAAREPRMDMHVIAAREPASPVRAAADAPGGGERR